MNMSTVMFIVIIVASYARITRLWAYIMIDVLHVTGLQNSICVYVWFALSLFSNKQYNDIFTAVSHHLVMNLYEPASLECLRS